MFYVELQSVYLVLGAKCCAQQIVRVQAKGGGGGANPFWRLQSLSEMTKPAVFLCVDGLCPIKCHGLLLRFCFLTGAASCVLYFEKPASVHAFALCPSRAPRQLPPTVTITDQNSPQLLRSEKTRHPISYATRIAPQPGAYSARAGP